MTVNDWSKPVISHSLAPTVAVSLGRFCDKAGNQLTSAKIAAFGISQDSADAADIAAGRSVAYGLLGVFSMEAGAATAVGPLSSDASGRAVDAGEDSAINGYGLVAATGVGDRIPVLFVSPLLQARDLASIAIDALTENAGAIGGVNDGDLPDLTVTATSPGTGADATTPAGAQWTAAVADITDLTAAVRELAVKVNAIIAAM